MDAHVNVMASTLERRGVPNGTAHRWINRAIDEGSWPVARVPTATRPARALVMPQEAFEALVAGLRGA